MARGELRRARASCELYWERALAVCGFVLLVGVWASAHWAVLLPWARDGGSWALWAAIVVLDALFCMAVWSYGMAALCSPGVPSEVASGVAGSAPVCVRCEGHKPARTHHCGTCGRCVLRMDHHCPWLATCVGARNHGHFVRLLFYLSAGAWLLAFVLGVRAYNRLALPLAVLRRVRAARPAVLPVHTGIVLLFDLLVSLPAAAMATGLLAVTAQNVVLNRTTLEAMDDARRKREFSGSAWSRGPFANACEILGTRVWAWPLPLPSSWQLSGGPAGAYVYPDVPASHGASARVVSLPSGARRRRDSEGYVVDVRSLPWRSAGGRVPSGGAPPEHSSPSDRE